LDVTIQSDLKWDSHINNITTKANKTFGFLRRNINISSTKVKEQAYKSLVRPSLEYSCSVWDPYTKEHITQLEQVQRRAARYVTNRCHNTSSVSNMIGHLNGRSLAYRGTYARYIRSRMNYTRNRHTPGTIHTLTTQDSNHSFRERYEIGTVSPWTLRSDSVESFKSPV
jgi:hypothetical protein